MDPRIKAIEDKQLKADRPEFRAGDTVRVFVRIEEDEKTRVQPFEGIVIARKGGSSSETFSVRRISFGEGVERTFMLHSPLIEKILVIKRGRVRRAKLYYLREKVGKSGRIQERVGDRSAKEPKESPDAAPKAEAPSDEANTTPPPVRSETPAPAEA